MSSIELCSALSRLANGWNQDVSLPDPEAAQALNARFDAWNRIEELQRERSFGERGMIILEFERRSLWKYLTDPDTGIRFPSMNAWMSCSQFLGCRRINYEAKKVLGMLVDVKDKSKLIDVPKGALHALTGVSTAVRNDPAVLEAAKAGEDKLLEKLETDHPGQHLERRKPMTIRPTRSERKAIDAWVEYATEHDIAGSITDAIVKACEQALHDAELDEELAAMPEQEETPA